MGKLRNCSWWRILFIYMRYIFIIVYPIILSPLLILHPGLESKAAYILLLMSGFWITDVIPLYMTALLPLVIAPLMGLLPSAVIAKEYSSSSTFLFLGGMLLAIAAENVKLHCRIAVAFMRWMGHDARLLMLSVMLPTWFLSMWMSNTATSVMMITVVEALLAKLDEVTDAESDASNLNEETGNDHKNGKRLRRFATGISLAVCYASSCGGIATLIGSPPNIIFYGLAVGSWMAFGFPISLLCLISTWLTLCVMFLGPKEFFRCRQRKRKSLSDKFLEEFYADDVITDKSTDAQEAIECSVDQDEDDETSLDIVNIVKKIAEEEQRVLGHIKYVDDTQPTILFALLAFIIPTSNPFHLRVDPAKTDKQARKRINRGIITWDLAQSRTSWGVLLLMGGGFALSKIVRAKSIKVHPFLLSLPLTVSTSPAFMLPAATTPNAIVYAKGRVRLLDMAKAGIVLNLITQLIVVLCTMSYGMVLFQMNQFPAWAEH